MRREHRYIVVGLGGIGSAAAYWLARRAGNDVLGLERFELGHDRGASQDHSRIIRRAYHAPAYVELARHAYRAWEDLEGDTGKKLIVKTGGLDLAPSGGAIPLEDYAASLDACGVEFERLDGAEVSRRWPQFRLSEDVDAIFQADAGIAPAADCNAAHVHMAREHGAELREHMRVQDVREVGGEIELRAGGGALRCEKLVVAADAWTNQVLATLGMQLPLTVTQEQVTYFAAPDAAAFSPERFPVWIWNDEPCFYGLPAFGEPGPKVAQDVGGREVDPDRRRFEPDPDNLRRVQEFVARRLPGALGPVIRTKTCLYTLTPDRDFVIDRVPGTGDVLVALGAAHGFKFASLIGRILAELAIDGRTDHDLDMFAIDREVLRMESPPRSFFI